MALSNTHSINAASYEALRLAIIGQLEGNKQLPYYDGANPPLVTIGVGFNISSQAMRLAVFDRMGITDPTMRTALTNVITSGTYNGHLISDLPDGNNPGQRNYELRAALDAAYGSSFMMTPQQIVDEFKSQADARELTISGVGSNTLEMIAVLSAEYNNVYGPGLKLAIAQDNRAEAWYELRYNSNADGDHAKRRYIESELLGLYDDSGALSAAEAREVFQMLGWHRDEMLAYETQYGSAIADANNDLNAISSAFLGAGVGIPGVASLNGELEEARQTYIESLSTEYAGIDAQLNAIEASNIILDPGRSSNTALAFGNHDAVLGNVLRATNDLLVGEGGIDTLNGGLGNDILIGGAGDDFLYGGVGDDVYVFKTGDGTDRITGDDNNGSIVVDGITLGGSNTENLGSIASPVWKWTSGAKTFTYRLLGASFTVSGEEVSYSGGTLWINEDGATGSVAVENFASGDLGLDLKGKKEGGGGSGSGGGGSGTGGGPGSGGAGAGSSGTVPPRRDPLVLDLDGDGIETTSPSSGAIILFDHDGDGVKTGTGWVRPDDAWLVLDRDASGTIDSGRELFGVDTLKSNGQLASDGFDALRDFDGNADDRIDALDGVFANLRIWRDLNQDGISQENELSTLDDNSIVSIGVNASAIRTDLGNGNIQTAAGTFTKLDGSTGNAGETVYETANLDLLINTFYREFTDEIPLTSDAAQLPGLHGAGKVRDLKEAASLSADLYNWVVDYLAQTSRQAQLDRLDGFLERWAETSDLQSLQQQALALAAQGVTLVYQLSGMTAGTAEYDEFLRKLGVVERFMGFTYGGVNGQARLTPLDASSGNLTVVLGAEQIANISIAYERFKTDIYESLVLDTRLKPLVDALMQDYTEFSSLEANIAQRISNNAQDGVIDLIEFVSAYGYNRLKDLGWDAISYVISTIDNVAELGQLTKELNAWTVRFAGSTEHNLAGTSISDLIAATSANDALSGNDGDDVLIGRSGDDNLYGGAGNDTLAGGAGADTLYSDSGNDRFLFGTGDGVDLVHSYYDTAPGRVNTLQFTEGVSSADVVVTRSVIDLVFSIAGGNDVIRFESFFSGNDPSNLYNPLQQVQFADGTVWDLNAIIARAFAGTNADDLMYGTVNADTMWGGEGNDQLVGYGGDDVLNGGNGGDYLWGYDGADVLNGGDGNDELYGSVGADTLSGGAGADVLNGDDGEDVLNGNEGNDALYGGAGVDVLNGGSGDDTINGDGDADLLNGEGGADTLYGSSGADALAGGSGNDFLHGGSGDNVLDGGADDDWLSGDAGNDTYLFGRGDGQDTISNIDYTPGRLDRLQFKAEILPSEVLLTRIGDNLIAKIAGTTDQVTFSGFFQNDAAPVGRVDEMRFDNGQVWNFETIKAEVFKGTAGADSIRGLSSDDAIDGQAGIDLLYGDDGNDVLRGGSDNDTLYGELGNDTLEGGTGNDTLTGGAGNNTYVFGLGDGQDTISDSDDPTVDKLNTLQFKEGISPNDVRLTRSNYYDLVVSIAGTADSVTIMSYYSQSDNGVQQLKFSDGSILALSYTMPAGASSLSMTDVMAIGAIGNDLNNTIAGTAYSNSIDGMAGADTLVGGGGDDTYIVDTTRTNYFWDSSPELWNFLDTVTEQAGDGYDTIVARKVYSATLAANTEKLIVWGNLGNFYVSFNLTQDVRRKFTGNDLDNVIDASGATGSVIGAGYTSTTGIDLGETVIDGGAGADVMIGSSAKTRFVVDNLGDVIVSNSAITRIDASISYTLAPAYNDLTLVGAASITGTGNALNNKLDGSANTAANLLIGGAGNDTYIVGAGDTIQEAVGEGTDSVQSALSYTLNANVENLTLTGTSSGLNGFGNALDNVIVGTSNAVIESFGNNYLVGAGGNDTLQGGGGSDTYADIDVNTGMDLILDTSGTADKIQSVFNSSIIVDSMQFSRSGNDLIMAVDGQNGVRVQNWYASPDNVIESLVIITAGTFTYSAQQMQNRADGINSAPVYGYLDAPDGLTGQLYSWQMPLNGFLDIESQHSLIYTATLADGSPLPSWLTLDSNTRTLSGTPPSGSAGSLSIKVIATDAGGLSTNSTFSISIAQGPIVGTSGNDTLSGDGANNILQGLGGDDILDGQGGVDDVYGGLGNDTLLGGAGDDYLDDWDEAGYGGNDYLDGGTGADEMYGETGNDIYVVDNAGDYVEEYAGEGMDEIRSSITYTLSSGEWYEIENLTLTGSGNINGTGNTLDNVLTGNSGSNTLTGGNGNDTLDPGINGTDSLVGGAGNDTYIVNRSSGITVTESSGAGTDTVQASVTYTLGNNVENLTLTGSSAINGTGNTAANVITGNSANNTLNGGTGADTLIGGAGNDTYTVDNTGDVVTELAGEGTDLINASVTYTASANVENLTLTGSSAINGTGNALDNVLTGNSGNNTLNGSDGNDTLNPGSAGTDVLQGGLGNDIYVIARTSGITVTENANEGTDTVQASVTYSLASINNVENLTLTGTSALNGTGNTLDNVLTGNSGNNTLAGSSGNDTLDPGTAGTDVLVGGTGNDTYIVGSRTSGITITENTNEGIDAMSASVAKTLGANVELLFLTGTSAINGTGNTLANLLRGNSGVNTLAGAGGTDILEGGDGNDTLSNTSGKTLLNGGGGTDTLTGTTSNDLLIGGLGNDALTTGTGADLIVFNKGDGQDTVAASTTTDNTLSLGGGALYADLLFSKSGNDLILKIGASDQITFTGYYTGSNRSVNTLQVVIEGTSDYLPGGGNVTRDNKVETFNFGGLVAAFDAALAANPSLTSWALTNALAVQYLSGSDTAAIGGDLAYRYNRYGTLSDISFTPAQGILNAATFGSSAQALQAIGSLQDITHRLS